MAMAAVLETPSSQNGGDRRILQTIILVPVTIFSFCVLAGAVCLRFFAEFVVALDLAGLASDLLDEGKSTAWARWLLVADVQAPLPDEGTTRPLRE